MVVIKKDGRKEAYDRQKLKRGLIKATWKRSVSMADIEKMLDEIERQLRLHNSTEFNSQELGKLILGRLKQIDLASYLAFASVYYNFENIDDYRRALKEIERQQADN